MHLVHIFQKISKKVNCLLIFFDNSIMKEYSK